MKILSLNVNDFGGSAMHLEAYKKAFDSTAAWREWDSLDKSLFVTKIFAFIKSEKPTIAILQEFDLNSSEAKCFTNNMTSIGYSIVYEQTKLKRPSMTVMFVDNDLTYQLMASPHTEKRARACAIKAADYIIYGTHVPS